MQKVIKYVIFQTKWGHFGLAGTKSALCRTQLPGPEPKNIESRLLKNCRYAQFDQTFFKILQERIAAYFEGSCVNFGPDIPVVLDGFGGFSREVLTACREIKFGQMITYAGLAKKAGRPAASRAVGNALAKNPLPLIIPCHRVLRADGKMGGFSAPGGISFKKRMLALEHKAIKT
ncbi:MAG: methylated-DNA--[protein]-cysteine S-methyltransferase [Candidatus Aminicenantes bacterium]|nr:methylated-DNA--[protein]-cysteine S-methyltransferase [Candidatus Aminicenantes bacterium]